MRTTQYHLQTRKETPADAEIISHQLMLRTGMISRLGSGLYNWSPLGLRVLHKIEKIVRKEMDATGCLEMIMPTIQPAGLWQETERWDKYGALLLKIKDRAGRDFCFGPTHEEVITDFARREIKSYKQLPITFYQIQTKFRDEIRPRFGVMRAREFLMKDAYSFHLSSDCLKQTYALLHQAYCNIFERIGLTYRPVEADSGEIGGTESHEFHVLADSGEDAIAYSTISNYAANIEKCEVLAPTKSLKKPQETLTQVDTPAKQTIQQVADFLGLAPKKLVKTLLVVGVDAPVALVLRGDHVLNEIKAGNLAQVASPLMMLDDKQIQQLVKCDVGSIGVKDLNCHIIVDRAVTVMSDFVCGANKNDQHLMGVNWNRDASYNQVEDLRNIQAGDPSPDGKGIIKIARGIEVGHIFQLGDVYTKSMNAVVLNEQGKSQVMTMGCYGIGVSRIVAATIEQNHDEKGIIWPQQIAPFTVVILPMNMKKSERVKQVANNLYNELLELGVDVLLDDRKIRPGVMFADAELLGIPHQITIGDKSLDSGEVEYKSRKDMQNIRIKQEQIIAYIKNLLPKS
ncbi:Prolyl-tRNA synthetase, bacterial type [hydrothermal vent metagenome]|uniref:proline--tRNA ligase n=1 Tax=hydrothermal vent metagenome TaxID=652676 RepID=A0A3B0V4Z7_9ZZZZ